MGDMPDILHKVCRAKRAEIQALKQLGRAELLAAAAVQLPLKPFGDALRAARGVALIGEVKKASPSAGVIRPDFDPVAIARAYERAGAASISVLTDRRFFQGSPDFLRDIREAVAVPLLRKDFILDALQVLEARALGADAYLLIAAALDHAALAGLMGAGRELGMEPLVEVHDERELETALDAGAELVGINNRNLRTFEVSLETTERLAPAVPDRVLLIAESGIRTRSHVERLKACGVKAVLVGESLMRAADVESAARALTGV